MHYTEIANWQMAAHFGNLKLEKECSQKSSVLIDWSHIGKISIRSKEAANIVKKIYPQADEIPPLYYANTSEIVVLRLVKDEYLILCMPGEEQKNTSLLGKYSVINCTGAMGCFVLMGPCKNKVWEKSTAMNLSENAFAPGMVLSTTVHHIRCTIYRTSNKDVVLHDRSLSQSLFEAFIDAGKSVALRPSGLEIVPVEFCQEKECLE